MFCTEYISWSFSANVAADRDITSACDGGGLFGGGIGSFGDDTDGGAADQPLHLQRVVPTWRGCRARWVFLAGMASTGLGCRFVPVGALLMATAFNM